MEAMPSGVAGESVLGERLEQMVGRLDIVDIIIDQRLDFIFELEGKRAIASGFERVDLREYGEEWRKKTVECG